MSRKQNLSRLSFLWLGSVIGAGCAFLTQIVLARELGSEEYGKFYSAFTVVSISVPLACFGVSGYWLKIFGEKGWEATGCFNNSIKYASLTSVVVFGLLVFWALIGPHEDSVTGLLLVLSFTIFGQGALELASARYQLEGRYYQLTIWQFIPHFLRLLFVSLFSLSELTIFDVYTTAYIYVSISVITLLGGIVIVYHMVSGRMELQGHGPKPTAVKLGTSVTISAIAKDSWPFGVAAIFHLIYFQSDIVLLKYLDSDEAAGVYSVAFVVMSAVYLAPGVIYQKFLMPKIHRWASHDRAKFYQVYRSGNRYMLAAGILSMVCVLVLGPYFIGFVFNGSYDKSIMPLMILASAAPIRFVATNVGSVLVTAQHMRRKVLYMGSTAIINIGINLIFIPIYGVVGAAITTVACELLLLSFYLNGVRHVFES